MDFINQQEMISQSGEVKTWLLVVGCIILVIAVFSMFFGSAYLLSKSFLFVSMGLLLAGFAILTFYIFDSHSIKQDRAESVQDNISLKYKVLEVNDTESLNSLASSVSLDDENDFSAGSLYLILEDKSTLEATVVIEKKTGEPFIKVGKDNSNLTEKDLLR